MYRMRRYLYMGVFFAGCASLAVELSASRLLGNYFGSSNLVWAVIIGLILIYLSVGYSIGGKWADRSPNYATFFSILCWAGLMIGLIPLASRPILRIASRAFDNLQISLMAGSFLAVLALFSVPVTLLGTASPFAVRLALEDKEQSGTIAGKIYTISTLGSFLGTFLPVLVLIPTVGTYRTFIILSAMLLFVALFGMWKTVSLNAALRRIWMPVLLAAASLVGLQGNDKIAQNIIYEDESAYNYIQVQEIDGYRLLRLNEGQGIHSIYHPHTNQYGGPWEQVLVVPFFYPPDSSPQDVEKVAVLGLAAGTSANLAAEAFPNAMIDGFEIDPLVIETGHQYFEMNSTRINAYAQDARVGIAQSVQQYDIISVDAYRPPYIPWHLTTREFFFQIKDHLSEQGGMVINVARIFDDRRILNSLYQTIASVFPCVYVVDIPNTLNSIIFATKQETNTENLILNYIHLSENPDTAPVLLSALETTILHSQPAPTSGTILTDDHAPVEWITNAMIIDLVRSESFKYLQ